jgi:hypothetical protein
MQYESSCRKDLSVTAAATWRSGGVFVKYVVMLLHRLANTEVSITGRLDLEDSRAIKVARCIMSLQQIYVSPTDHLCHHTSSIYIRIEDIPMIDEPEPRFQRISAAEELQVWTLPVKLRKIGNPMANAHVADRNIIKGVGTFHHVVDLPFLDVCLKDLPGRSEDMVQHERDTG